MERPLLCLLILLPLASAIPDDAGDVAQVPGGPPVIAPHIDLVEVEGLLDNGTLTLRIETAGVLRPAAQANTSIELSYLFIVAIGADQDVDLYTHLTSQAPTLVVRCAWHQGMDDAGCQITEGDGVLRGLIIDDRNLTARLAVDWNDRFAIGAAATESHAQSDPQVIAQDFTDNALPYRQPDPQTPTSETTAQRPWWQSPWLLFAAVAAGVAFGLWRRSKRA